MRSLRIAEGKFTRFEGVHFDFHPRSIAHANLVGVEPALPRNRHRGVAEILAALEHRQNVCGRLVFLQL